MKNDYIHFRVDSKTKKEFEENAKILGKKIGLDNMSVAAYILYLHNQEKRKNSLT
jgi:antitoxin component of RelBE/YafQ-DinJ toxin-antitoxin module